MQVIRKKIGEAFQVNGVRVGVLRVAGNQVVLGLQCEEPGKRFDMQIKSQMPQPKNASTPEAAEKANRDLAGLTQPAS